MPGFNFLRSGTLEQFSLLLHGGRGCGGVPQVSEVLFLCV
jgi:hypothetical protein